VYDTSEELLQEMAKAGDGLYRNFSSGQQIDFLDINYSSVARPFGMTNIIVTNTNSWPESNTLGIDSDGDGVTDLAEFDANVERHERERDVRRRQSRRRHRAGEAETVEEPEDESHDPRIAEGEARLTPASAQDLGP